MYHSGSGYGSYQKSTVNILIVINIMVFIIINIFRNIPWSLYLGLVPSLVISKFMIWQLATYLFVHADLWHLVLNMLMLWMFGSIIENRFGSKRFLFYYFFTGIGAGLCSIVFAYNLNIPVVGASGSIFGLLIAHAVMFPESVIILFFIFPMKMKYAAIVLAGINLLGALSNPGGGIAYIAHLGGALFGYLYMKNQQIFARFSEFSPTKVKEKIKEKADIRNKLKEEELDNKVDRILDKISAKGIESLTEKDREILKSKTKK